MNIGFDGDRHDDATEVEGVVRGAEIKEVVFKFGREILGHAIFESATCDEPGARISQAECCKKRAGSATRLLRVADSRSRGRVLVW